jgi:XisH protein
MARDKFHQEVRDALEKEGWNITDDPLYLKIGRIPIHIDLGAEKLIAAEKNGEKIAIEIKTFGRASFITSLYEALGKYLIYREALLIKQIERTLYLALPKDTYDDFSEEPLVQKTLIKYDFKLILYDADNKLITSWIK